MYKKIVAVLIFAMILIGGMGAVNGSSINKLEKDYTKMTPEELIRNFDPNCKDMGEKEILQYIDRVRLKSPPIKTIDEEDLSNSQKPSKTSCGQVIYEAPWGLFDFESEEDKWGIADAGCEGEVDGYQGWTNIAAAAGPGIGESSMTVWITHGVYFKAPITDTYSVYFDYTVQGWVKGGVTWIDACVSGEVALFFRVAGKEVRQDILYQQTVPIVYQQFEQDFKENKKPKMSVEMYENNYYYIEAIAGIKARSVAALLDFGYSYGHFDNEDRGGWGDGTLLNSIKIEWSNTPPDKPYDPEPSDGSTDVEINPDLSWKCDDMDGDKLTYDIYFGKSNSPPKIKSDYNLLSYSLSEELEYETKYYWKIVAKDGNGGTTPGSVWSFTTKKEKSRPRILIQHLSWFLERFDFNLFQN